MGRPPCRLCAKLKMLDFQIGESYSLIGNLDRLFFLYCRGDICRNKTGRPCLKILWEFK